MIEVVFVIVVLGILAAIAIPRFAATRTDAQIAKGRSDIAAIRSAIVSERQTRLIRGDSSWITGLSQNTTTLFDGNGSSNLLMYGITSGTANGKWRTSDTAAPYDDYIFKVVNIDVVFDYDNTSGKFDCNTTNATYGTACKLLVE